MEIFFITLKHELKLGCCYLEKILANFLFFLIFISGFFLLSNTYPNHEFHASIIIWFSLLSCLIFSSAEFLKRDFEDGCLEQVFLSCENFEIFILAKILANWLMLCLPIIIAVSFLRPESKFLLILFFASLAINFICCFCGSLSILGNTAPAIAVIALPLIIPILLIAHGDFLISLKLLPGVVIFLGSILTFAITKIVKIAAE